MATRRDQLHSYQFMMQRVISSVMQRETDPEQTPLRRGVGAVFGGVMLTGLLAIAFAVYGVISGNFGTRWQQPGAIVIERETGAHFIYQDGVLQPVLNYASAKLLSEADTQRVPGRNLAGIARTAPVGIPGAPDSLPPVNRMVGAPWTLCSVQGEDPAGSPATTTILLVGAQVPDHTPLGDQGMVVRDAEDHTTYLIWRSHRYRITGEDPDQVIRSLYGFQVQVVEAGTAWLNGLPAGPDIGPVRLNRMGEEANAVAGRRIGDIVFHPVAGGEQYYLVLDDGLAHLTELQMLLVRGEYAVEPVEISAAAANTAPASDALAPAPDEAAAPPAPPELAPVPATARRTLCAETSDARVPPQLSIGSDLSMVTGAIPTMVESPVGTRLADWILVPAGHIAVVRAIPSDTAQVGSYHLVTDVGRRFPVPSEELLGRLGYRPALAVDMPAALVQRIPAGPTLDAAAAAQPAPAAP